MKKEIENIFSFKKTKDNCPNRNNPIIIDTREKNSMILSNLKEKKANILLKKLEIGDYIIGKATIERKTITDLFNSLKSNRLKEQLKNLKQCMNPLIILERNKPSHQLNIPQINQNILNGVIISITLNYKIPIIYTNSEEHTSQVLIQIAKRERIESRINPNKIPKTLNEQKRFILEAFPGIGSKTSEELLNKFKTLKQIFNANEEELNKTIKQKITKRIIELLNDPLKN